MLPSSTKHDSRATPVPAPAESSYLRSYFYVGGKYVDAESGNGQRIFAGQMYVEHLTPSDGVKHPWPIVFIQGGGQAGTTKGGLTASIHFLIINYMPLLKNTRTLWKTRYEKLIRRAGKYSTERLKKQNFLNTPDGRKGWASWLLDRGYTVYLFDQVSRGRSPYHPSHGPTITYTAELAEKRWTACRDFQLWPEATLHTQWPGSGRVGDPVFDAYYASTVPSLKDYGVEQTLMQAAGAKLLDRIGSAILITHSQGGTHGWLWADARPELVKAIVAIEPSGPPFQSTIVKDAAVKLYGITDVPISYGPPVDTTNKGKAPLQTHEQTAPNGKTFILQQEPARRLKNLSSVPVLLETGEASSHASYDESTVRFLRQAGVNVKHLKLADKGIHGNGHLQFLEKNNLEIIELLEKWIRTIQ